MTDEGNKSSTVQQLESLYEEKETLRDELGVSDPEDIISMVHSLQDQVEALYEEKHHET
ncbi:MAG: hypothetical protein ABEK50_15235 [bacterium]